MKAYKRDVEVFKGAIMGLRGDERRIFAQWLFNRLMFVAFTR